MPSEANYYIYFEVYVRAGRSNILLFRRHDTDTNKNDNVCASPSRRFGPLIAGPLATTSSPSAGASSRAALRGRVSRLDVVGGTVLLPQCTDAQCTIVIFALQ